MNDQDTKYWAGRLCRIRDGVEPPAAISDGTYRELRLAQDENCKYLISRSDLDRLVHRSVEGDERRDSGGEPYSVRVAGSFLEEILTEGWVFPHSFGLQVTTARGLPGKRTEPAELWSAAFDPETGEVLLLFGDPNAREATPVDVEFTCEDRRREDPCPICGKPREEEV